MMATTTEISAPSPESRPAPSPATFLNGVRAALPIVLGYLPIGFAFGVLAAANHMPVWAVGLMSLIVYAGSAQFIGTGLWAQGASPGAIIATTFLVNLRHLLLSAALSPSLRRVSPWRCAVLAYNLTDESFGVATATLQGRPTTAAWLAGLHWTSQLTWIAATIGGAALGKWLPPTQMLGLDFALPAMFVALLVMQLRHRRHVVTAVVAGILSVLLALALPGNWNVILATIIAATFGVLPDEKR